MAPLFLAPAQAGTVKSPAAAVAGDPANGPAKVDPFCASYGAGFARLSGTSTCVKISGNLQADGHNQSSSGGAGVGALQPALRSQ
ncbi:porin [Ancylobacter amanitiformis]|uniref:Porin n=1 Tax=Ancylobacter amanitiformis TaxID=217069 RepID=A0ABU0LQM9_9HYPH|nr:porin [Ancylobacter amanitiformis]MDQ0510974.1 hypothetical protein [Ancylobacter amanitiformis]